MRQYETGFLVSPNLTEDEAEAIIQQMAEVVTQKHGRMSRVDKWGKRRTAYQIKKFHEATYVFFHYESGPEVPVELARRFRQMDTILRHLTLVKETQLNVRKKKKAAGRGRGKDGAAAEEAVPDAGGAAEAAGAETKKREEA
jgi:small subunit ribosomal protein S6